MSVRSIQLAVTDHTTFTFNDAAGAPITGKTQGNFTLELSDESGGNVSTTGITITEVDASNNAGEYRLDYNGATSFIAAQGYFKLIIRITEASIPYTWNDQVVVTTQRAIATTYAAWTPTSSDGRIFDGSNPIDEATIVYSNGSGTLKFTETTNSSGLHNTIYFTETMTGTAQKSGFNTGTFTVTVSGGIATGPLSDVTLTSVSTTALDASALWSYWKRTAEDRTGAKADLIAKEGVNDALRTVAKVIRSEFWYKTGDVVYEARYNTGTLTVTQNSTTATLAGGTWPTNAALGELTLSGRLYTIDSRSSSTVVVLDTPYAGESGTVEGWSWSRPSYALEDDMYEFHQIFQGNTWSWGATPISWQKYTALRQAWQISQTITKAWCIAQGKLWVWPAPLEQDLTTYSYYGYPTDLVNGSDVVDIEPNMYDLIYRAIDYQVSLKYGRTAAGANIDTTQKALDSCFENATQSDRSNRNDQYNMRTPSSFGGAWGGPRNVPSGQ